MKKIILVLLILGILMLSGCKDNITGGTIICNEPYILVGTDCCLDKDGNSICDQDETEEKAEPVEPPKEETIEEPKVIEEPIVEEEIVEEEPKAEPSNEFLIKIGESIKFDEKTVTLVRLNNLPELKAVFNVDGVEIEVYGTKNLEIIKDIELVMMRYISLENAVIVKLEKFELGEDEELVNTRTVLKRFGKEIKIKDIFDNSAILLDIINPQTGDVDLKVIIKEGESLTSQGITITNLDSFPKGVKIERYAVIKIQQ